MERCQDRGTRVGTSLAVALMIQAIQVLPVTALAFALAPQWAKRQREVA